NKKEYLTVPYRSITAFSITSAGTIDIDAEIAVFLSGHPPIEFKVGKFTNTEALQKLLASRMNAN
ncbi:MAG: PH domain-containing protein, partial [Alteriqipengyuania sp.]